MQQSHREQMAFKEMRKEAEKEEEAAYRETMLAKFAEDDRIEQMNAQKRRMKQLEHRRAVEKLIEERKQQHQADMVTTVDQWWANVMTGGGQHDGLCMMEIKKHYRKNVRSLSGFGELRRGQALVANC